jgi:anti-sigma regulatory factor (Ser/Thr protein kinase)
MCPHPLTGLPRPAMDIEVELEPTARAPGLARGFVARELAALGYPQLVEDARLMVSELVTNSVAAAPDRPLWIDIRRCERGLMLEVWDCSPEPPAPRAPEFFAEGGRGLQVVDELSAEWGYDLFCCGKVI